MVLVGARRVAGDNESPHGATGNGRTGGPGKRKATQAGHHLLHPSMTKPVMGAAVQGLIVAGHSGAEGRNGSEARWGPIQDQGRARQRTGCRTARLPYTM